jgi:4-hydroxy-4-methyl-2-oxoglutarate aldolase
MKNVIKNHARPSAQLLEEYSKMQAATLHEVMGKKGAMTSDIRPTWSGSFVVGSALTVKSRPGDNLMLHKAVAIAQPGDILVVDADGFCEAGIWGEIITAAAQEKGIVGIITNGAVRDSMPIKDMNFPMFSRALSMKGTTKANPGTINNPIVVCGVTVNAGDIVLGDNDGVVVVPLEIAEKVLEDAKKKEADEAEVIRRIRAGESTMDILGFQAAYDALNLSEEE